jgi:hypothetical protein
VGSTDRIRFDLPMWDVLRYVPTGSVLAQHSRISSCGLARRSLSGHVLRWSGATGFESDGPFTLPGCLVLRFDDSGLCEELREYWHLEADRCKPPGGWGA